MTKQEFLAFSLPDGLKCKEVDLNEIFNFSTRIYNLMSILNWNNSYQPILRPLSDLTKEIEHNGEKFVPLKMINYFSQDGNRSFEYILSKKDIEIEDLPFWVIQLLLEWHFDIADLISKGEAIDVNTLDTNPYK